ncbi:MAG: hypothetical protein Q7V15_16205 [Phenylobacterium sp.]|uniref:hypothetical protein n=1 Tax=Phenylobacterium sp. TaxID=1871053 RepID=UPI0027164CC3|nr:hypothetical protein [Phenylobacterium sp.]MDO8902886.1 hypothetical protein [Phenylobacterium sp.]MDP2215281.1 hypothetical protein [Phenylobacterium sp.]
MESESIAFDQDFHRLFYRWSGHFSAVLIRTRARFDGDLDQYVLYLTFLLSELADRLNSEGAAPRPQRGLNALSLSEITGIPRESARRKLLLLAANGYLNRDENGLFTLGERYGLKTFFDELKPLFTDPIDSRS